MMVQKVKNWQRAKALTQEEKDRVVAACDQLIQVILKPRYLPVVHVTSFNYPVDILGKMRGNKYCFSTRYRSGFPENAGEEFNVPFARLDHIENTLDDMKFNLMWHRHTGQWFRRHASVTFEEALQLMENDGLLRPVI
jgi:hypothetical protein